MENEIFVRLNELATKPNKPGLLPYSPATVWRQTREGLLPPRIHLGSRITAWNLREVETVKRARLAGADDEAVRELVRQLVAKRGKA
jgi:predicted DNA-binding transcriptional regulator AlpA